MIEVIYNENPEDKSKGKTSLRLPKNIRQIGNTEEDFKIYIEDYVVTFLNQLTEKDLSKILSNFYYAANNALRRIGSKI